MKSIYYVIEEHKDVERELSAKIKKINELAWDVKFLSDLKGHLEAQIKYLETYSNKEGKELEVKLEKILTAA
ncbi:MAG: hypothetical protein ACRC4M_01765 [Mycoplasma sp.]